jgi:hypothetical protein
MKDHRSYDDDEVLLERQETIAGSTRVTVGDGYSKCGRVFLGCESPSHLLGASATVHNSSTYLAKMST